MKKLLPCTLLALSMSLLPLASLRAESGSWNGWITDAKCGAKGASAAEAACTRKCAANGEKLVFFNLADKKLYKLDKQDLAKANIGHAVVVKGDAKGDSIQVTSIVAAPAAPAGHPVQPPARR